jgi:hypothetical protein
MTPSSKLLLCIQSQLSKVQAHRLRLQEPISSRVSLVFVPWLTAELSCHEPSHMLPFPMMESPRPTPAITQVQDTILTLSQCFPTTLTRLPSTLPVLRMCSMIQVSALDGSLTHLQSSPGAHRVGARAPRQGSHRLRSCRYCKKQSQKPV